jgi:chromate transporter
MLPRPRLWKLFTTFFIMGIQSFGGGTSTLFLIHQSCVDQEWLTEDEFLRAFALVQISPGINLVKLTMLVGYHLRGWPGLIAASAGLLLPSALVTVLMTAGFTAVSGQPLVQAAMKGVLPATVGLSLAMGVQMAQPILVRAHQEGPTRLAAHLFILATAALFMVLNSTSPVLALVLSGALGMLLLWLIPVPVAGEPAA